MRTVRTGLVQLAYVLVAVGLGLLLPRISVGATLPSGRVTDLLVAFGAGFVPFIGIVYSLLFLVVQHGATTFTPRLNIFRDSPIVWNSFSYFTAIVVFAFTAALAIADEEEATVLLPIVALVAVLAGLAVFRGLQASAFRSIQLAATLAQVAERGREVIDDIFPDYLDPGRADHPPSPPTSPSATANRGAGREVVWPGRAVTLQTINTRRLIGSLERADALAQFLVSPGDLIPERGPVAVVHGDAEGLGPELLGALGMGTERTFDQDPSFALRVLADIALRALSPAVNDPTTAVQALDTIDGLLRALVLRDFDVGRVKGGDGEIRIVLKLPRWDDYVAVAFNEITAACPPAHSVRGRLGRLLHDLLAIAPTHRREPLERLLVRLDSSVEH